MKLLVCTQAVDKNDPVLGFFHSWIAGLAERSEKVTVLTLRVGEYALPDNVRIVWLGKTRLGRAVRVLKHAVTLREEYDSVFVHMNQEYILLAGWLWKALGKRIYLWRNHYEGNFLTDLSAAFCTKVFCTSKFSYTAKYKNTVLMPVGVDTRIFRPLADVSHTPRSILFLARMAPSKRPNLLVAALQVLKERGVEYSASFYGSPLPKDAQYYERLKAQEKDLPITFYPAVPNTGAPRIYSAHEVFVNCSPSGMFDKTMFEAAACGCVVLASSQDFAALAGDTFSFKDNDVKDLASQLERLLSATEEKKQKNIETLKDVITENTTEALMDRLIHELSL